MASLAKTREGVMLYYEEIAEQFEGRGAIIVCAPLFDSGAELTGQ